MKVPAGRGGTVVDQPAPATRLFLFSGADASTSRLLAQRLRQSLGAEKVAATGTQLKSDPRWLADEAASISMFGEPRLLWVEPAGEEIVPAVQALLDLPRAEAVALAIVSSSFKKDSGLRKLGDTHPGVAHIASEQMSPREQAGMVMELATAEGLRVLPQLAQRIAEEANGDLQLAKLELQKFALYLDAQPGAAKDLDEEVVDQLGIDQAEADLNRPGDLALAGELSGLSDELQLLESSAVDAIPVVRALQRRLLMLAPLRAKIDNGQRTDSVLGSVWKRDKAAVARILPRWSAARLADVLARVQKLERELLLQPVPERAALGEALLQIGRAARR